MAVSNLSRRHLASHTRNSQSRVFRDIGTNNNVTLTGCSGAGYSTWLIPTSGLQLTWSNCCTTIKARVLL